MNKVETFTSEKLRKMRRNRKIVTGIVTMLVLMTYSYHFMGSVSEMTQPLKWIPVLIIITVTIHLYKHFIEPDGIKFENHTLLFKPNGGVLLDTETKDHEYCLDEYSFIGNFIVGWRYDRFNGSEQSGSEVFTFVVENTVHTKEIGVSIANVLSKNDVLRICEDGALIENMLSNDSDSLFEFWIIKKLIAYRQDHPQELARFVATGNNQQELTNLLIDYFMSEWKKNVNENSPAMVTINFY